MDLLSAALRRWYLVMPILLVTSLCATVVQQGAESSFTAHGVVMIVAPDVDPGRSVLRGIVLSDVVSAALSQDVQERALDQGGTSKYTVLPVGPRRIQVLATEEVDVAATTVEVVLRDMEHAVLSEQRAAERAPAERVRARLIIDVPESTTAVSGTQQSPEVQVVGTLLLLDPLEGAANPYGSGNARRLLTTTLSSESERERIGERLDDGVSYALGNYERRSSGMLQVTTRGPSEEAVLRGFSVLIDELSTELEQRQDTAQVPVSQRRLLEVLATPQRAEDSSSSIHTPTAAVIAVGLLLAAGAATLTGRRRDGRGPEPDGSGQSDGDGHHRRTPVDTDSVVAG